MELNRNGFFRATPQQLRSLSLLILIFAVVVCWPCVQWAISAVLRENPMHSNKVGVSIPYNWIAVSDSFAIQAWTICPTIFCSDQPRSSIMIQQNSKLSGMEDPWIRSAERILNERQFNAPVKSILNSPSGEITCLESRNLNTKQATMSCFGLGTGVIASFEGDVSDLQGFHSIVESVIVQNQ